MLSDIRKKDLKDKLRTTLIEFQSSHPQLNFDSEAAVSVLESKLVDLLSDIYYEGHRDGFADNEEYYEGYDDGFENGFHMGYDEGTESSLQ